MSSALFLYRSNFAGLVPYPVAISANEGPLMSQAAMCRWCCVSRKPIPRLWHRYLACGLHRLEAGGAVVLG